ncbi:MAG: hypothetical protein U9O98_09180, partial [Asgard group archaeon]|nr:hypothetical protein [Asgard group archaeon]
LRREEKFNKFSYILFEIGFVVFALPAMVVAFFSVPFLVYFSIIGKWQLWPFILIGVVIAFTQIMGVIYLVNHFYLEPLDMRFGEFLRHLYEKRKNTKKKNSQSIQVLYEKIDNLSQKLKEERREQTDRIYNQVNY